MTIRKALEHTKEVVGAVVPGNHGDTTRVQERTWIANKNGATSKPEVLAFEMRDGMPSEIGIYQAKEEELTRLLLFAYTEGAEQSRKEKLMADRAEFESELTRLATHRNTNR